jgi:hypothetical protein
MVILPKQFRTLDSEKVSSTAERPATVVCAPESDLVVCCEGESLAFLPLMKTLAASNPRCAEIAERLHTRIDVDWRSIASPVAR